MTEQELSGDTAERRKSLRLVFPQWQGASIASLVPELDPATASLGYMAGARILDALLPRVQDEVMRVPVRTEVSKRTLQDGVYDRNVVARQCTDALKLIRIVSPDTIVTLGGECSVSVPPFAYLAAKYGPEEVAVLWLDAHPDITLPGDPYAGYHAMALGTLLGHGDARIISSLPAQVLPENVLLVGLRDWEREEVKQRQQRYGLRHVAPSAVNVSSEPVLSFLQERMREGRVKHVLVHFDLDVLDPVSLFCAVGKVPDGVTLTACVRLIQDVAKCCDLVGLTVAEFMPRLVLKLTSALQQLPLVAEHQA